MKNEKLPKLIVILGPTASGKTGLAIKLAKKFNGEIVSADSGQVYKEMDIGTVKPTKEEIRKVPHYLINVVRPNREFNVAIYKKVATKAIKDIQKRGKLPFLVGGTGLYIQAVVDNIDFPKVAPQKKIRKKLERKTPQELFKIYKKLDPKGAKFIDKHNKRRLIRAIEVCKATKESFWQKRKKGKQLFDTLQIGIKLPREKLKTRIEKRVKEKLKEGLEKEVKTIIRKYGWGILSLQLIGYREWKWFFEGKINKKEVETEIILHTMQFAKRQMTWFKKDKRIKWIKAKEGAEKLIREFLLK